MSLRSSNTEKIYLSSSKQQKELTILRSEVDWIREAPRHAEDTILNRLDEAWQRCFAKLAGRPNFKKKSEFVSISEFDCNKFYIKNSKLKFSKLGLIKIKQHRTIKGKPKVCTIKKIANHWYVYIQSKIEYPERLVSEKPAIGLDLGVVNFVSDSQGNKTLNPRFNAAQSKLLTRIQRKLSRKKKGSVKYSKTLSRLTKVHSKIKNRRNNFLHNISRQYANSHGFIVMENLKVSSMIKGICSSYIADAGWGLFQQMLAYKAQEQGSLVQLVDPRHTSQTCSHCGHIDGSSRKGSQFNCTACNHSEHADTNAAKNILSRADRSVLPVEGDLLYQALGSGKVKLRKTRKISNKETSL